MHAVIKNWFSSLSQREQVVVSVGGVVAILLLGYGLIVSPLFEKIRVQEHQFSQNQASLTWILHANAKVRGLRHQAFNQRKAVSNVMLVVEHSLAEHHLASHLTSVKAPQPNQVQINLRAVPFDSFMAWLQELVQASRVNVVTFLAAKSGQLGKADVQVVLQAN